MHVKRPIIVVGTGRCGSTIFHKMFATHPNMAWLSVLCDWFPNKPFVNRTFMHALDVKPLKPWLPTAKYLRPWEPYKFWESCTPGFAEPCRDLRADDVLPRVKRRVTSSLSSMLTSQRDRLLLKITGWPRLGFFQEIFTDAKFIHVVRDGRAVVNSLLAVPWWSGWHGPQRWRWGELTPEQYAEWDHHDKSFVALAGIEWKILMAAMADAKTTIPPDNFMEIRYEDFCATPWDTFQEVMTFCELPASSQFEQTLKAVKLNNTNTKWQTDLTDRQKNILNAVLREDLARYGY